MTEPRWEPSIALMRVDCQHCGVGAELGGLVAVEGGFGFRCEACEATNLLAPVGPPRSSPTPPEPPPPEPTPPEPLPPGMTECPKCGHRQYGDEACHRCGLDFARLRSGQHLSFSDPLAGHPLAETLRARWACLAVELDDEAGHREFIGQCAEHGLLEFAGQCYRKAAAGRPEDPRITAYRDRVIQAAMARVGRLEDRARHAVARRFKGLLLLGVIAFLCLAFAIALWLMSRYQIQWRPPL